MSLRSIVVGGYVYHWKHPFRAFWEFQKLRDRYQDLTRADINTQASQNGLTWPQNYSETLGRRQQVQTKIICTWAIETTRRRDPLTQAIGPT